MLRRRKAPSRKISAALLVRRDSAAVVLVLVGLLAPWPSHAQGCPPSCTCSLPPVDVKCKDGQVLDIFTRMKPDLVTLTLDSITSLQRLDAARMSDMHTNGTTLIEMTIVSCSVKDIGAEAFHKFPNLEYLDLSQNEVTTINPSAFSSLGHLLYLNLSHNQLSRLDGIFTPLGQLRSLDLNTNFLKELSANVFSTQNSLTSLRLDRNPLRSLSGDSFKGLNKLKELRARDCSLVQVDPDVFHSMVLLSLIDLGHNRLSSLPSPDALSKLMYLKVVYLDNNEIQVIPEKSFPETHLQTLDLSYNRISKIDASALAAASIRTVDLSFNLILKLEEGTLKPLAGELENLNLAGNPLRHLLPGTFSDLKQMRILNLSGCSLLEVRFDAFNSLTELKELDLSQNTLHYLPEDLFSVLNVLKKLYLQSNQWVCDCKIKYLRDWLTKASSLEKLSCTSSSQQDCQQFHCVAPTLPNVQISELKDTDLLVCQQTSSSALPASTQGAIVASCMGFAIVLLIISIYIWRREKTGHQLKKMCTTSEAESSHVIDEDSKVPPLPNCDRNSLTHSDHNFVFRHYFDHLVTDPEEMDTTEDEEVLEAEPLKQKDSLYSSQPSLYSNHSDAAYGMESTV